MASDAADRPELQFTEKGFYLGEFRGRTLALAAPSRALADPRACEPVLKELEANRTGLVLITADPAALDDLLGTPRVETDATRLEGRIWRALQRTPRVGVVVGGEGDFAAACREVALRLRVSKLVWLDAGGGLLHQDGSRRSFVDLEELVALLRSGAHAARAPLLREIESGLCGGLAAINLCTPEGLADELFTYAGSGTLFTRERYIDVHPLGLDDFSAAYDLLARGVVEGYLAPRSEAEIDRVFACGVGAFVEGRHLAGIGALLPFPGEKVGEVAALYTLTRFLGEGVGAHLVAALVERARDLGCDHVFACTTAEPVARFFERQAFRRVSGDEIPQSKWERYDPARRPRVQCLRRDVAPRS